MAPVAKEFDKIIKDGRERRKNEALASKIFSKGRRQSAPSKLKTVAGPSLASRVGVRKIPQRAITSGRRASVPSGNVNGEWTHDLHHTVRGGGGGGGPSSTSLGGRVTMPGGSQNLTRRAAARQAKMAAAAAGAMGIDDGNGRSQDRGKSAAARGHINVRAPPPQQQQQQEQGISIRGIAGPFAVMGQNFAPGTSPADVESAMTPIGGEMVHCAVVKTQPFLMMEMVFASKEGAERVMETFNNKTADGRILKVYPKVGGYQPSSSSGTYQQQRTGQVIDGSMGFAGGEAVQSISSNSTGADLFSDRMVAGKRGSRGGRRGGRI
ncbi:RNA-binding protein, rrm type [Cordyceps javanica]|uniref:RNA-binding protein, rrm type n=1 Tax=Cordyceps javanica TaxID=43265 RepID=A0A545VP40_9HYPO|nr:RNA-binding protein, rrm type [Cordyceps javanica]TQW03465.1 RNA-binding protein, rrm type [Cordyceps javanica]